MQGAYRAIQCLVAEDAEAVAPSLLPSMERLLDRSEAESLSLADLRIFQTPEGGFSSQLYASCHVNICMISNFK